MSSDWQAWVVIPVVLLAALFLARRLWLAATATPGRGCDSGCGSCGVTKSAETSSPSGVRTLPLVTLQEPLENRKISSSSP